VQRLGKMNMHAPAPSSHARRNRRAWIRKWVGAANV
jgi:hypothetical protein